MHYLIGIAVATPIAIGLSRLDHVIGNCDLPLFLCPVTYLEIALWNAAAILLISYWC
jgi:hypothetical protein